MLAFAMMAAIRHRANIDAEQANDTPDLCDPPLIRWSIQEIRRIANRLAQRRITKALMSSLGRFGDERIRPRQSKPISG